MAACFCRTFAEDEPEGFIISTPIIDCVWVELSLYQPGGRTFLGLTRTDLALQPQFPEGDIYRIKIHLTKSC